jgi:hydrogenase nickel incorporation protein HypB
MCENCGCGNVESFSIIPDPGLAAAESNPPHEVHTHEHGGVVHHHEHGGVPHDHPHPHDAAPHTHTLPVHLPILAKNDRIAERNRGFLKAKGLFAINIVSSPGSGKTTLIAKTLEMAGAALPAAVIVGDLETTRDADRLRGKGAPVVQVTTGTVCHLDAEMIASALEHLDLRDRRLLIIENVGNLVCPASFDLGEALRVVIISVTEGEDKPLKYPPIFHGAGVVVVSKIDMLAASGLDIEALRQNIRAVAPDARIIELSARTGEGLGGWMDVLGDGVSSE